MISAFTNLTVTPNDTVVLADDSTAFGCSSTRTSFTWSHKPLEGKIAHFYKNKNITVGYERLGFRMETNEINGRNLKIENVTTDIAGKYECVDVDDDDRQSAELTVLGEML